MKQFTRWTVLSMIFVLAAAACAPSAPAPSPTPVDVQATANAMAATFVAQTQAALPTATFPPTSTATEAPTLTPTALPPTATLVPTMTDTPDACNQPLTQWKGDSAKLILDNQVENSTATVSLYIVTPMGECGYMSATFSDTVVMTVPVGSYSAWAWVDGAKQDFSAGLSFRVVNGSWRLIIKQGRLAFQSGCAPNC